MFGDGERVAAQDDRGVMMQAREPPTLVMVEPELVLQILVGRARFTSTASTE